MPAGRPTLYTPELLKEARAYIDNFEPSDTEIIPMVAGLAVRLRIARKTVYEWMKDEEKAEFCDIVEEIMAKQEQMLFKGGLSGEFNASITKLALTKHDYSDKQELSGNPDAPLVPILNVSTSSKP
jgi:hypothetical protein